MAVEEKVNHPSHYNQGEIEVIDAIEAILVRFPGAIRYHVGNVIKYICRAPFKNGVEDLQKAQWYLHRAMRNPIVPVDIFSNVYYTIDMDTFIKDQAEGYEADGYVFVASILHLLAFTLSPKLSVEETLEYVDHDLTHLIKVVEKATK